MWRTSTQALLALAEARNRQKLPELGRRYGLRLPPDDEDCLLAPNYQLQRGPAPAGGGLGAAAGLAPGAAAGLGSTHGARRVAGAKQIHIRLQGAAEQRQSVAEEM